MTDLTKQTGQASSAQNVSSQTNTKHRIYRMRKCYISNASSEISLCAKFQPVCILCAKFQLVSFLCVKFQLVSILCTKFQPVSIPYIPATFKFTWVNLQCSQTNCAQLWSARTLHADQHTSSTFTLSCSNSRFHSNARFLLPPRSLGITKQPVQHCPNCQQPHHPSTHLHNWWTVCTEEPQVCLDQHQSDDNVCRCKNSF